jgi:hypothetical protein
MNTYVYSQCNIAEFFLEAHTFPNQCVDKIKKGYFFQYIAENSAVCQIMWKNKLQTDTKNIII